jgi:hypothetical protein
MNKDDYFKASSKGWVIHQILMDNLALEEGVPLRLIELGKL